MAPKRKKVEPHPILYQHDIPYCAYEKLIAQAKVIELSDGETGWIHLIISTKTKTAPATAAKQDD